METLLAAGAALWLGILTSISPCPLATNIAAVSYVARRVEDRRVALLSGALYTLGRTAAYALLGIILTASLLSIPSTAHWLQKYLGKLIGPFLILAGMVVLELITIPLPASGWGERVRARAEGLGVWGSALLGFAFALAFCPTSAALFFGSLLPLALESRSGLLLPALYGVGTGLPVLAFGVAVAAGARSLGKAFEKTRSVDSWMRTATGWVIILMGVWLTIRNIFMA